MMRRAFLALAASASLRTEYAQADAPTGGPRCFLTPARIEQARTFSKGPLALAWKRMQARCDGMVRSGVVTYKVPDGVHDPELLWERNVGNALPTLAMGYFLSGNETYKKLAIDQSCKACGYTMWAGPGLKEGVDLAAGHLLLGIALVVDWLGDQMDAKTRTLLLATLERRGQQMAAGSATVYWCKTLLQNHLWVNMTGLLAAGLALQPYDAAKADPLIAMAAQRMQPCFPVLAADGSDQEGAGYWTYGAEYLLKYHQLATELLSLKIDTPWLHKTAEYCIAMTLPLASVGPRQSIFDMADSVRTPYYGPEYMLRRLASLNQDGAAQEMAAKLEQLGAVDASADWLNFLWYDPAVPATGLSALPTLQHFDDLGLVVARSDRSGSESALMMRAGPPLGKAVQAMHIPYDIGTAHVHPDVNHITLFGGGEFLLVDNGYTSLKDTFQHNTLVVNGKQQLGSGAQWMKWPSYPIPDPQPALTAITSQTGYDYWVGEGAAAYPSNSGLTQFDRHVLFVKPNLLVVVDDLEAASAAEFLLLWHTATKPVEDGHGSFLVAIQRTTMHAQFILPPDSEITTSVRPIQTHGNSNQSLNEIGITVKGRRAAHCASVFTWTAADGAAPPPDASVTESGGLWTVRSGEKTLTLDLQHRQVSIGTNA